MRLLYLAIAVAILGLLLPQSASAHGDLRFADRSFLLEPGARVTFQGDLHYHRLVGTITADGPVFVQFVDDRSGEVVYEAGPSTLIQMNQLVRCCDDLGWAPFTLVIENRHSSAVEVEARARLVHDDFAVFADGAEDMAHESIPILGVIWMGVLWSAYRRNEPLPGLRRATGLAATLTIVALGITAYGMLRYGSGVIPGFFAGLSDIPIVPTNPIVSGTSLLLAILGIGWAWAVIWWMRAREDALASSWVLLGLALLSLVVAAGILFGQTYGVWWVPIAAGVAAGLPLVIVIAARFRPVLLPALARE